jgi:hypothetical protein
MSSQPVETTTLMGPAEARMAGDRAARQRLRVVSNRRSSRPISDSAWLHERQETGYRCPVGGVQFAPVAGSAFSVVRAVAERHGCRITLPPDRASTAGP